MLQLSIENTEIDLALDVYEQAKAYIYNSKSSSTRKAYRSDWNDFSGWCSQQNLSSLPSTPQIVTAYLVRKAEKVKPSTLKRRLVSINHAHLASGHKFDSKHPLIVEVMKGIDNVKGTSQTQKAPILLEDLQGMMSEIKDDLRGKRDRALLLLGFSGAFRRSELVSIQIEDCAFVKDGLEVLLRRSKTDQAGQGHLLAIPYGSKLSTCPVRSIQDWIESSDLKEGALFRGVNRHGHISSQGLNAASVALIVKRNQYLLGREGNFSGHSLRAGFCTQAARKGVPEHAIMKQSRHKTSACLKRYIRIADRWKNNAASELGL